MSYFSEIDYNYYGDREDPEVNVRYYLNQVIIRLDSSETESELLKYKLSKLWEVYSKKLAPLLVQADKARTNSSLEKEIIMQVISIVRLKRLIQQDDNYSTIYDKFTKTVNSINSDYNRALKLMRNTSIKSWYVVKLFFFLQIFVESLFITIFQVI